MQSIRRYCIAISGMFLTSVFSLLVVGTLTYIYKWQADKAMIGIIITYILAGFAGGFCMRKIKGKEYGKKLMDTLIVSVIFMLMLILLSCVGFQNRFELSTRFILIWMLVASSVFLGLCVKKTKF